MVARALSAAWTLEKHSDLMPDGYIEVRHVVPVSQLGDDYVVDPKDDLIPLCPNCHAVAH